MPITKLLMPTPQEGSCTPKPIRPPNTCTMSLKLSDLRTSLSQDACDRHHDSPELLILSFWGLPSLPLSSRARQQGYRSCPIWPQTLKYIQHDQGPRTTGVCFFIPPIALGVGAVHTQKQGQALASFWVAAEQGRGPGGVCRLLKAPQGCSPAPSSLSASSQHSCHHVVPGPVPGNVPGVDW